MHDIIQMMWVQNHLPLLARNCITSFIRQGHPVRLYCYDGCDWACPGLEIQDASTILPRERIYTLPAGPHKGTLASFADVFRYHLLHERGGWWADTDLFCLRPFDCAQDTVISRDPAEPWRVVNTILKAPAGSDLIREVLEIAESTDKNQVIWTETNSKIFGDLAHKRIAIQHASLPHDIFLPWSFVTAPEVFDLEVLPNVLPGTKAVHLFNDIWRRLDQSTDAPRMIYPALDDLAYRAREQDRIWGQANVPIATASGDISRDVTLVVKTFRHPSLLERLVTSVRRYYPAIRILVADDGRRPVTPTVRRDPLVSIYTLPFNSGLGVARNFLLDRVATPYLLLLGDDCVFTQATKIEELQRAMVHTGATLAGGQIPDGQVGTIAVQDGKLLLTAGYRGDAVYQEVDYLPNFFLARTTQLRQVRWDDHIKMAPEQLDFFLRLRGRFKMIYCPSVAIWQNAAPDPAYAAFYAPDEQLDWRYLMDKWGLTEVNRFGAATPYPAVSYPDPTALFRQMVTEVRNLNTKE